MRSELKCDTCDRTHAHGPATGWYVTDMAVQCPDHHPARSEAEWGDPSPDCPRCHGTGTYRLTPDSRLRPCRCGLTARSEAAGGEEDGDVRGAMAAYDAASTGSAKRDFVLGFMQVALPAMASLRQQLAAAREDGELTGCCVECGRPPEITVAHVDGVRCMGVHPRCACAAGLRLWPAARTEPAREGEGGKATESRAESASHAVATLVRLGYSVTLEDREGGDAQC